jgi:hypothetical protein
MFKLILIFVLTGNFLFAQTEIKLEEIPEFIGRKVKVCDKIYGSYVTKNDPPIILLNVGKPYPDSPLTLVIFSEDLKNFSYEPAEFLADKSFCATGKLILYKEMPEIILNSEKDLEILGN